MNLLNILQKERSKKTCIEVADFIGNNPDRFAELIEIKIYNKLITKLNYFFTLYDTIESFKLRYDINDIFH